MTIYRQNRSREARYLENRPAIEAPKKQEKPVPIVNVVEALSYNCGTAVIHIIQAGACSKETQIEILNKAIWHITREITRLENK